MLEFLKILMQTLLAYFKVPEEVNNEDSEHEESDEYSKSDDN